MLTLACILVVVLLLFPLVSCTVINYPSQGKYLFLADLPFIEMLPKDFDFSHYPFSSESFWSHSSDELMFGIYFNSGHYPDWMTNKICMSKGNAQSWMAWWCLHPMDRCRNKLNQWKSLLYLNTRTKDCQTTAPSLLLRLQASLYHWAITGTWT